MADIKVSALPVLTVAEDPDFLIINDVSTGSTKRITRGNLLTHIAKNFTDSADGGVVLPTGDLTLANELIAGGDISTSGRISFGSLFDYVNETTVTSFADSVGFFDSAHPQLLTTLPTTATVRSYVNALDSAAKSNIYFLADSAVATFATFNTTGGLAGSIVSSGTTTAYNVSSDYRLKENIVDLSDALDRIQNLPARRFNFIGEGRTIDGFIAHELAEVIPEAVTGAKDAATYQQVDLSKVVPLLVASVKELKAELDAIKQHLDI
jgi:hypothetical protein